MSFLRTLLRLLFGRTRYQYQVWALEGSTIGGVLSGADLDAEGKQGREVVGTGVGGMANERTAKVSVAIVMKRPL